MSGLEVLATIASVWSVIEFVSQICKKLADEPGNIPEDLQSRIAHLGLCLEDVKRLGECRKAEAHLSHDEIETWKNIRKTLDRCSALLKEFDNLRKGSVSKSRIAIWTRKNEEKDRRTRILDINAELGFYLLILSLSVQSLDIIINTSNHSQNADATQTFLRLLEVALKFRPLQPGENNGKGGGGSLSQDENDKNTKDKELLHNCLSSEDTSLLELVLGRATTAAEIIWKPKTEAVRQPSLITTEERSSISFGPTSPSMLLSEPQSSLHSVKPEVGETNVNAAGNYRSTLLLDFTPYSDKILPQNILEDIINRLGIGIDQFVKAGHYRQAVAHKLVLMDAHRDLHFGYKVPLTSGEYLYEYTTHETYLAEICELQGEAMPSESQKDDSMAAAEILVEVFLKRGRSDAAESVQKKVLKKIRDEKQILHLSHPPSPDIVVSEERSGSALSRRRSTTPEATELFRAILAGDEYRVQYCLGRKPLNLTERRDGKNAIMHAVAVGNVLVVEMLKEAGASLKDALFYSVRNGFSGMIRPLLALGAKVDEVEDSSGRTPLHVAAGSDDPKVLEELLYYNADANVQDAHGQKAIHCIAQAQNTETQKTKMMEAFLQHRFKSDVNAIDQHGKTALHHLALTNGYIVAGILLDHNADTNIKDNNNQTALQIAINRRTLEFDFVELMLKQGMAVDEASDLKKASPDMKYFIRDCLKNRANSPSTPRNSSSSSRFRL